MRNDRPIFARLTALALLLALVLAPLFSAVTHGPGQLAIEADHAAWHAEQGAHWHATDHGHHGSADHDHSTNVILPATGALHHLRPRDLWPAQTNQFSGVIHKAPHRPPRLT